MGPTTSVVVRAARRVGLASLGEVVGRAVNIALPFLLLALHGPGDAVDRFFIALALAFFVFGSIGNAMTLALVPLFVERPGMRWNGRSFLIVSMACAACLAALPAWMELSNVALTERATAVLAVAIMSLAGLLGAPAVATLNATHRYGLPGLMWSLRLLPVGAYAIWAPVAPHLGTLLAGLAFADVARAAVLHVSAGRPWTLRAGDEPLRVPRAAMHLLAGAIIVGLLPLAVRAMALVDGEGALSLFEAADRVYGAMASLASIGVGSVSAVYLARLGETRDPVRGWRLIQGATLAWGLGWLALALTAGLIAPEVMTWLGFAWATGHDIVRDLFLVLALGIPGVVASGVFGRRLLAQGLAHHLVPVALSSVATGLVAGALLSPRLGLPGLAAGLALSQYVACIHSALVLRREGWNAHPRAG